MLWFETLAPVLDKAGADQTSPSNGDLIACLIRSREWFCRRKIDRRSGDVVEVVGEGVQRDVGHDFRNCTVIESGTTGVDQVTVCDPTSFLDDLSSQVKDGIGLGIDGGSTAAVQDLGGIQADHFSYRRMGCEAVVATVGLCHQESNLLSQLGRKRPVTECAAHRKVPVECGG